MRLLTIRSHQAQGMFVGHGTVALEGRIEWAKAQGITLGRFSIEDSDAGKYEAIKAPLAVNKRIR